MVTNYLSYLNEASKEEIGKKVKIRDDSEYKKEAGESGIGIITILNPHNDFHYSIKWDDNGESYGYRRKDFDFIDEDEPVRVRWYKKGKLNEGIDDKSGSRVKVKDDSKYKEYAYYHGGNGYGTIINQSGKEHWDPKTRIQYYYYDVVWDNGYETRCRISDIEIEPEPERIRWYKKGKLNENLYYDKHKPSSDDVGKKVKISSNSVYRDQAYDLGRSGPGDGKGIIIRYSQDEDYGNDDDHIYQVKWNNGENNAYRLIDLSWDEEENKPVKTRWYKKGKLEEAIKWYKKGKLTLDPDSKIVVVETTEEDFIDDSAFKRFLIDHGCLKKYIRNCGKQFKENFKRAGREDYINLAFTWDESPEGESYWSDLDEEWNEIIEND